jgi:hypothetical protein
MHGSFKWAGTDTAKREIVRDHTQRLELVRVVSRDDMTKGEERWSVERVEVLTPRGERTLAVNWHYPHVMERLLIQFKISALGSGATETYMALLDVSYSRAGVRITPTLFRDSPGTPTCTSGRIWAMPWRWWRCHQAREVGHTGSRSRPTALSPFDCSCASAHRARSRHRRSTSHGCWRATVQASRLSIRTSCAILTRRSSGALERTSRTFRNCSGTSHRRRRSDTRWWYLRSSSP